MDWKCYSEIGCKAGEDLTMVPVEHVVVDGLPAVKVAFDGEAGVVEDEPESKELAVYNERKSNNEAGRLTQLLTQYHADSTAKRPVEPGVPIRSASKHSPSKAVAAYSDTSGYSANITWPFRRNL
jgi:hypothetical protein